MFVNLNMDKVTKKPITPPEIITRGFIATQNTGELILGLRNRVVDTASRANGNMQKDVEQAVSNYLYKETKRRPMIIVNITKS